MARAVAVNVGANTGAPGFRGPVCGDGSFTFVPIPETEPTRADPPTYRDLGLDLPFRIPAPVRDVPVHLDPEFASYPGGRSYTYGDPHGVKASPILDLEAGDFLLFYATLDRFGEDPVPWLTPDWGTYLIGHFRLDRAPLSPTARSDVPAALRDRLANNAHLRREDFDARVLAVGDRRSRLYDRAVPLSASRGTEPNRVVTDWSSDSGAGPWWRRPLRFDEQGTRSLRGWIDRDRYPPVE
ncbi:MAG: hypothetical protein ABEJ76_07475 [Halanaeroarchaeum sp.]